MTTIRESVSELMMNMGLKFRDISGIYCQFGDYIPPIPPMKGTRNSY